MEAPTSLIPDIATLQKRFDALPLTTFQAGETVLAAGSRTGLADMYEGWAALVQVIGADYEPPPKVPGERIAC
jgi:hypothetical protein